jgi:hypothetical protein
MAQTNEYFPGFTSLRRKRDTDGLLGRFGESASVAATGVRASAAKTAPETTILLSESILPLAGWVAARQAPGGRSRSTCGRSSERGAARDREEAAPVERGRARIQGAVWVITGGQGGGVRCQARPAATLYRVLTAGQHLLKPGL